MTQTPCSYFNSFSFKSRITARYCQNPQFIYKLRRLILVNCYRLKLTKTYSSMQTLFTEILMRIFFYFYVVLMLHLFGPHSFNFSSILLRQGREHTRYSLNPSKFYDLKRVFCPIVIYETHHLLFPHISKVQFDKCNSRPKATIVELSSQVFGINIFFCESPISAYSKLSMHNTFICRLQTNKQNPPTNFIICQTLLASTALS